MPDQAIAAAAASGGRRPTTIRSILRLISAAATREQVANMMRFGFAPPRIRAPTRSPRRRGWLGSGSRRHHPNYPHRHHVRRLDPVSATLPLGSVSYENAVNERGERLDYDFFKTKVEPIFLKKREGHMSATNKATTPFGSRNCPRAQLSGPRNSRARTLTPSQPWSRQPIPLTVNCSYNHWLLRRAATPFTPAAGNSALRTTLTGKLWRSGSPVKRHRSETPSVASAAIANRQSRLMRAVSASGRHKQLRASLWRQKVDVVKGREPKDFGHVGQSIQRVEQILELSGRRAH